MKTSSQNKTGVYSNNNQLIILLILFYIALSVVYKSSLSNFNSAFIGLIILLIISLIVIKTIKLIRRPNLQSAIQASFVFLFFAYFFGFSSQFQLILYNHWQDAKLIDIDKTIWGNELSLTLEKFITPYLTEAMMFAYIFYLPLLIITAIVLYKNASEKGLSEYLFVLSLSYIFCYVGFILFPVASQMYFMPEKYSAPLIGGFFTYVSELIRHNLHFRGGSLPSPHCAAATIILWASYKYSRKVFFVILPSVILLYISTIYGRFHYAMDSITGILIGCLAITIYPLIIRIIDLIKAFFDCILHPVSIINSLSE